MPRHYKKNRAKRRTAWETYNYWYDVKTKTAAGKKKYHERLTKEEFEEVYADARRAGVKNPAKTIAEGQRKLAYKVQRGYEELIGRRVKPEEIETKEAREILFYDLVDAYEGNYDKAREDFESLY